MVIAVARGAVGTGAIDGAAAPLRIAPGATGVSIWSPALFADGAPERLRDFLGRAFVVAGVTGVELRRRDGFARIRYAAASDARAIWRELSRSLRAAAAAGSERPAGSMDGLYLDPSSDLPLEITRIGAALSSWSVRHLGRRRIRLASPLLRRRRDLGFRLQQAIAAVPGVQRCRVNTLAASVAIAFDPALVSPERLARQLERVWPTVVEGLDGPPSRTRLLTSGGLLALAAAGQFALPALRPFVVAGVAIYGFPNVSTALGQARRFRVGLPALYAFGLGLMILGGAPFNAALFAVLMQAWPQLAHATAVRGGRELFASYRARPLAARLCLAGGGDAEVEVADLREGDVVTVEAGDVVPVDGIVVAGLAAVEEEHLSGVAGTVDKAAGDRIHAASYLRDGAVKVRVENRRTVAEEFARLLPIAAPADTPSALEAERIANRNARLALTLAVASLFVKRLVRPSQAIIRPDYVTAHRLGARLAALHGFGDALACGSLLRHPGALDWLAATDTFVFDETADIGRRRIAVVQVFAVRGTAIDDVVRTAASAFPPEQNDRVRALADFCAARGVATVVCLRRRREAGRVSYVDGDGHVFQVDSAALQRGDETALPDELASAIAGSATAAAFDPARWPDDPLLRPLLVRRDGRTIGAVAFGREGAPELSDIVAMLQAADPRAHVLYLSSQPEREARTLAGDVGIADAIGGLDASGKARAVAQAGPRTLWIGNGADPAARIAMEAARVSISVAGFRDLGADRGDIVLLDGSPTGLPALRRVARDHRASLATDYRVMYATNLTGVAGGIVANLGGLQAGLLSNAGTAFVYLHHRRRLLRLAARAARLRASRATPGRENTDLAELQDLAARPAREPRVTPPRLPPAYQKEQRAEGV